MFLSFIVRSPLLALGQTSVCGLHSLIDYTLLFSVHRSLSSSPLCAASRPCALPVSDAVINVVVMTPVAANGLAGAGECVGSGRDRQAGPRQADLSPPHLSSMLIINPTYSALPVSPPSQINLSLLLFPLSVLFCPSAFTPLSPPPSLLQQSYTRENY